MWARAAAALIVTVGGSFVAQNGMAGVWAESLVRPGDVRGEAWTYDAAVGAGGMNLSGMASSMSMAPLGEIVGVRSNRRERGALLPLSDDPLLDGADLARIGDATSTSLAATAPLWPAAQMAAHAAYRFAAMEFGDVQPVTFTRAVR